MTITPLTASEFQPPHLTWYPQRVCVTFQLQHVSIRLHDTASVVYWCWRWFQTKEDGRMVDGIEHGFNLFIEWTWGVFGRDRVSLRRWIHFVQSSNSFYREEPINLDQVIKSVRTIRSLTEGPLTVTAS